MSEAVLRTERLTVTRSGRTVLSDVDLCIDRGAPMAIVGPSGCGKTTLLLALAGLIPIASGRARVMGDTISALAPRERAKRIGVVFQDYQLFPHLTVMENVCLAPSVHRIDGHRDRAETLLTRLEIDDLAGHGCHELSGGQRQRVAIARCLVLRPSVVLFDEPSAALDPKTSRDLAKLLGSLSETTQVVVVSHDPAFVSACCPRAARLEKGRIAGLGTPADLFDH